MLAAITHAASCLWQRGRRGPYSNSGLQLLALINMSCSRICSTGYPSVATSGWLFLDGAVATKSIHCLPCTWNEGAVAPHARTGRAELQGGPRYAWARASGTHACIRAVQNLSPLKRSKPARRIRGNPVGATLYPALGPFQGCQGGMGTPAGARQASW